MSFLHGMNFVYRHVIVLVALLVLLELLVWGEPVNAVRAETILPIVLLGGALALQESYRQRFYLDWRREAGFHWRAAVLHYASWPWFVLALVDVLVGRRPPYAVTRKSKQTGRWLLFIGAQLGIAAVIILAWVVGVWLGRLPSPAVMALAGVSILVSLALSVRELTGFPSPWDSRLEPFR
jgi:hypothetical protein